MVAAIASGIAHIHTAAIFFKRHAQVGSGYKLIRFDLGFNN